MEGLTGPATPMPPGFVLDDVVRHAREGPLARVAATAADMFNYLIDDSALDQVQVPVELVWGDADDLMTMEYAQRLMDGLPAARLHPVHGCGHAPQRECPDRFLEALGAALAQPPPEPATAPSAGMGEAAAETGDAAR